MDPQRSVNPSILDMSGNEVEPADGCGSCTACCTLIGVAELKKENFTKCQHICGAGCAIYQDRPNSCRVYNCLYRLGLLKGGVPNRPDNLGILVDVTPPHFETPFGGPCMLIMEVWPGASKGEAAREVIENITSTFPALLIYPDGVLPIGPPKLLERAGPYLRGKGYRLEGELYVSPDAYQERKWGKFRINSPQTSTNPIIKRF
jgi:hypothetical protein